MLVFEKTVLKKRMRMHLMILKVIKMMMLASTEREGEKKREKQP